jgi:glycosyltransferase involved in cell wall biosynthesis
MSLSSTSSPVLNPAAAGVKPKVLHIVGDRKMGGVKSTLGGFINSFLGDEFEFSVLSIVTDRPLWQSLRLGPEVIICHHPCRFKVLPVLVLLRLLHPQAKILIHEHGYCQGYEPFNVAAPARFHRMLRCFYGLADQVVAISQSQAAWMRQHRLVNPDKLTMIHQCTPLQAFFEIPPKPREETLIIGAYGRFCEQKGFDVLLKAMAALQDLPITLRLGGEGLQEPHLRQLAQGLNNIEFWGRIDNVPQFLQACDLVVIPSRWEPWGNVCQEAKAAGRPVIASDVDGLREQVQENGLLVPVNDPQGLAQAIRDFLQLSPTQIDTWVRQGRESVQDRNDRYYQQWQQLLHTLLSQPRSMQLKD